MNSEGVADVYCGRGCLEERDIGWWLIVRHNAYNTRQAYNVGAPVSIPSFRVIVLTAPTLVLQLALYLLAISRPYDTLLVRNLTQQ